MSRVPPTSISGKTSNCATTKDESLRMTQGVNHSLPWINKIFQLSDFLPCRVESQEKVDNSHRTYIYLEQINSGEGLQLLHSHQLEPPYARIIADNVILVGRFKNSFLYVIIVRTRA